MANENYTNISAYVNSFSINIAHIPSGKQVSFAAFLNSFNDSYKTNFKSTPVYGRMDPIANYQNTTRTIAFSFTVPAASDEEAKTNLEKISTLIKFQYPEYTNIDSVSGINSPPICKVKFQNLINEYGDYLYGYFAGVDFVPVNESGYFIDDGNNLFPKEFKVSLNFTVLHTKPVGWSKNEWKSGQYPYKNSVSSSPVQTVSVTPDAAKAADTGGSNPIDDAAQKLISGIA